MFCETTMSGKTPSYENLPQIPDVDFDEGCGNPDDFFPQKKNPPQKITPKLPRASYIRYFYRPTKMAGEGFSSGPAAVPVLLPTLRLASRKLLVIEVGLDIWLIVDHQDDDMVPSHF